MGIDFENQIEILIKYLKRWTKDPDITPNMISILTPNSLTTENIKDVLNNKGFRTETLDVRSVISERSSIQISTVEDFKGLEAEIICIMAINLNNIKDDLNKFFYKSFSRARHTILCISETDEEVIKKIALTG